MRAILDQLKKEAKSLLSGMGFKEVRETSIGIDIGSKCFRAVRVKKSGKEFSTKSTFIKPIAELKGLKSNMHIADDEEVSINFRGAGLIIKKVNMPIMPYEEIEGALKWELKEQVDVNIDTSRIKFSILGERAYEDGTKKVELMVVIYKEKDIESRVKELKDCGLNIQAILPTDIALSAYVNHSNLVPLQEHVAVIDIGAIRTGVSIVENGKLYFRRELAIGGDNITDAMINTVALDEDKEGCSTVDRAEKLKCEKGIPENIKILSMIRPLLERLANEISSSLEYCESQFKCSHIKKIILSGNGSKLKGLREYLSNEIGVEVLTVLPEDAVAIGLALTCDFDLNMLPEKFKLEKKKAFEKLSIRMISIVFGFIFLFSYGLLCIKAVNLKKELQIYTKHWEAVKDLSSLKDKRDIFISAINTISSKNIKAGYIMKEVTNIIPSTVALDSFIIDNHEPNAKIRGLVLNEEDLSKFMSNLENSALFENVKLVFSGKTGKRSPGAVDFEIQCNFAK